MGKNLDAVLTLDELAHYLKISRSTLYKLARAGKIPARKVGRSWRFQKSLIDQWLKSKPSKPN